MCTNISKGSKIIEAPRDGYVYKVLIVKDGVPHAPFHDKVYTPDTMEETQDIFINNTESGRFVSTGYHSFLEKKDALLVAETLDRLFFDNAIVVMMMVPKGSRIIIGEFSSYDTIVSSNIFTCSMEPINV